MERLQPLSKLVVRNDKTINQEAFYDFTQSFVDYLESLNSSPPYQCNRTNKSIISKYCSFLFQIITKHPDMAISISPLLYQLCSLLMNPLNDNQIRDETWRSLINCINCYDVLVIFKSFLAKSFEATNKDTRLDVGEIGKVTEETLFKQFEQIIIKLKKSPDFEKVKLNLQILSEALSTSALKLFSVQFRNKIVVQLVSEIGLLEKKFKSTLFDTTVEPKLIIYISEIVSYFPSDQTDSHIIYRFVKWTFPYVIQNEQNEDVTKRANMLFFINHSKYRGSLSLSYFKVLQSEPINASLDYLYKFSKDVFHNVFIRFIDRSMQILPSMINSMMISSDNYAYIYNMCKFFTHVLRLKGLTNSLLRFESEKTIIGYYLSISIYNLQYELLPFMTLFFLSFLVDRKSIDLTEEGRFSDNLLSIVHQNYITQIVQSISIFASQLVVSLTPAIFKIEDKKLKKQFLKNPIIFEKENIQNMSLRNLIKQNAQQFNSPQLPPSTIATTIISNEDKNNSNPLNLMKSNSSDNFFKCSKSIHFFFNINCYSYTTEEAIEFLSNYIQCFSKLTNECLIPIVIDAFSCIIELLSNFKNELKMKQISISSKNINCNFDFSFMTDTFLPFAFKKLLEYEPNSTKRSSLFYAIGRMIRVLKENFLFSLPISKFWCVSLLSTLQKNTSIAIHTAIQACLDGFPLSFSLVHAIFLCISDRKIRDSQTVAFLTCMAIISPEFRNYSLQELEVITSSAEQMDNNLACMSILLLLHNLYDISQDSSNSKAKKSQVDKEVRVIFLNSLGKMRSSPLLMSSLLLILPSFFDKLESQFELIFDTILMDVNELMIKIIKVTNPPLKQASSYGLSSSNANFNNNNNSSSNFPINPATSTSNLISSLPKNPSLLFIPSSPIAFVSTAYSSFESQPDSDPVLNSNIPLQQEEPTLPIEKDYTCVHIFKSISLFCVNLFLHSKKRLQIRKTIVEYLQSWTNYNNNRTNGEFHYKFKQILSKAIGMCFSPPKSKNYDNNLMVFTPYDETFISKQSASTYIVNDTINEKNELCYNMKISLNYSSSIYSVKQIRESAIIRSKPISFDANNIKIKTGNETKDKLKPPRFRNLRNEKTETKNVNSKNPDVCVPGLSLFLDALSEANGCQLEERSNELRTDFIEKFESNFKKKFFIRLMFFGKKINKSTNTNNTSQSNNINSDNNNNNATTNDNENNNSNNNSNNNNNSSNNSNNNNSNSNSNINNSNNNTTNNENNTSTNENNNSNNNNDHKNNSSNININNANITNDNNNSNNNNDHKNNSSNININNANSTNDNNNSNNNNDNKNNSSTRNSNDDNNNSANSSVNNFNRYANRSNGHNHFDEFSNEFSPLFIRFLNSLGVSDPHGNIWASTTLYDAVFQIYPNKKQDIAVVWVDDAIYSDSIIKQLSIEKQHLVLIVLSPSKSGIIHTKVIYSSVLLDFESSTNENGNGNGAIVDDENDVYYFNSYYNHKYPSGEVLNSNLFFFGFGPLIGSLFFPYTIVAKLVTETAINAAVFRKAQLKKMNQNLANKRKRRKLFPHRP